MGLYIDGKRLSELTTESGWAGSDILTGLKSGDNKNITITELTTMVIDNVETVDPLPPGTYAKVMYKGPVSWGASTSFVTDGNIVGIGLSAPNGGHQLEIKYDGTANNLFNMYKKDISDAVVKNLTYSSTGIFFVADSSIPANIDSNSNANTYSSYFHKGIIANDDVYMNNANGSGIRFGDIDITTGAFTTKGLISQIDGGGSTKVIDVLSDGFQVRNTTGVSFEQILVGDTNTSKIQGGMFVCRDETNGTGKILLGESGGSIPDQAAIDTYPMLRIISAGSSSSIKLISNTGSEVLEVDSAGRVLFRLPPSVGGTIGATQVQMYLDGGILKAAAV